MKVYLLDKNIVECIHRSLKGKLCPHIKLAKDIDCKKNRVSPLLAVLEGSVQKPQSDAEILNSLNRETEAIKQFYRRAKTDGDFLQHNQGEMIRTLGEHFRKSSNHLIQITIELQKILARTYSVKEANRIFDEINSLALNHKLKLTHPLLICAIMCLYGHTDARGAIKPKEKPSKRSAYNAVVDIRMLMETAYIRNILQKFAPKAKLILHTADKSLNKLEKSLLISAKEDANDGEVTFDTKFDTEHDDKLLPNLADNPEHREKIRLRIHRSSAG